MTRPDFPCWIWASRIRTALSLTAAAVFMATLLALSFLFTT